MMDHPATLTALKEAATLLPKTVVSGPVCKEAPVHVAVFVMSQRKSSVFLPFFFFCGSLNSLAQVRNDEIW